MSVEPCILGLAAIVLLAKASECNDGKVPTPFGLAHAPAYLMTAHARHADIQ